MLSQTTVTPCGERKNAFGLVVRFYCGTGFSYFDQRLRGDYLPDKGRIVDKVKEFKENGKWQLSRLARKGRRLIECVFLWRE